jgi:hypothetical protein
VGVARFHSTPRQPREVPDVGRDDDPALACREVEDVGIGELLEDEVVLEREDVMARSAQRPADRPAREVRVKQDAHWLVADPEARRGRVDERVELP